MGSFGVGERLRGRGQRGRFQNGEHLLQDPVLQPAPAQALAAFLAAIQLLGAGAHIARAVTFGSGVAGLHQPAALPAAQPALQQRRAFPRAPPPDPRGARQFCRSRAVLASIGGPVDEPGMVIGNEHRPLLAGQQHGALHHLAGRIDAFLGAGAAEHERPGIDRIGEQVVHRRVGRRLPSCTRPVRVGRRGSSNPSPRSDSSTCRPVPSSAKRRNTVAIASTTASSGVITTAPVSS